MKHAATQEIFSYWNTLRAARPAPSRTQINPTAIPKILPDIFLLETNSEGELIFRLAGTRLCALFGRELRGTAFRDLWLAGSEYGVDDLAHTVLEEKAAVVAGAEGFASDERGCNLELILLPLDRMGAEGTCIVGCLSASPIPEWFSIYPLSSAFLKTTRICWPSGRKDIMESGLVQAGNDDYGQKDIAYPASVRVGSFVVYEGGRQKSS